jgi:hypothetical protein
MDSRWRNLLIAIAVLLLFLAGYWLFSRSPVSDAASTQPPASYEWAEAEINAVLLSTPGFEPKSGSFKTIDAPALEKAKQQLVGIRQKIQSSPHFSEKPAALALAETWIGRIELALSWKQLQETKKQANFVGTESDSEVCAKKTVLLELRQRLENARNALLREQENHDSFASGFSVLAAKSGFLQQTDSVLVLPELEMQLETVNEILGACS